MCRFQHRGRVLPELDLMRVANVLNMVGAVTVNEEEGWCSIDGVTVFDGAPS